MLTSVTNRRLLLLSALLSLSVRAWSAAGKIQHASIGVSSTGVRLNSATIPRLASVPALEDFEDMGPRSDAARSMAKVSNFTQQQAKDGSLPSQKTHAYFGYD